MILSIQEFYQFGLQGKLQLLKKDGQIIAHKFYSERILGELYELYGFHVEKATDVIQESIVHVSTLSKKMARHLYSDDFSIRKC